jgi:hypothetical protein
MGIQMSESIAARVGDDTAEWLEQTAAQKDTSISKLVDTILEQHIRNVDEPATEAGLDPLEERVMQIEQDIEMLCDHAEKVEHCVYKNADLARGVTLTNGNMSFPQLPTNHEGNTHGDDIPHYADVKDELPDDLRL